MYICVFVTHCSILAVQPKDLDFTYIDLWRGTPFILGWLVSEGNLSESGLAQLIGGGFKKGSIIILFLYWIREHSLAFLMQRGRSCRVVLYRSCQLTVFIFEGELLARGVGTVPYVCVSIEVEFLEEIQTEVLRVFLLAIHRHLY